MRGLCSACPRCVLQRFFKNEDKQKGFRLRFRILLGSPPLRDRAAGEEASLQSRGSPGSAEFPGRPQLRGPARLTLLVPSIGAGLKHRCGTNLSCTASSKLRSRCFACIRRRRYYLNLRRSTELLVLSTHPTQQKDASGYQEQCSPVRNGCCHECGTVPSCGRRRKRGFQRRIRRQGAYGRCFWTIPSCARCRERRRRVSAFLRQAAQIEFEWRRLGHNRKQQGAERS